MEVPDAVLEKLKCENCESYLSRGPVLMLDNEASRCGRCSDPKEGGKRNKPYEELAQLMKFPCRYKKNGCEEKIRFEENKMHEEACAFRMHVCPIADSGKCEVRGSLLEHCKTKHPDKVIENPGKFTHDITRSSLGNYLLFAYQVLFLVQTKVCTVTKKIYHSVRLLDDTRCVSKYSYDLDIANATDKITKHGKVVPQGCLALQEETSVAMDINGLLAVLGEFKDIIFTLTVQSKEDKHGNTSTIRAAEIVQPKEKKHENAPIIRAAEIVQPKEEKNENTPIIRAAEIVQELLVQCARCSRQTKPVFYLNNWLCQACAPPKGPCANFIDGCRYKDITMKTDKHKEFHCQSRIQCAICGEGLREGTLDTHYTVAHSNITQEAGNVFPVNANAKIQQFIINTDFGKIIFRCVQMSSSFVFQIFAPLVSDQLYVYRCLLKIHSFDNNLPTMSNTATTLYADGQDWMVTIPTEKLIPYIVNKNMLLSIEFIKTEKLDELNFNIGSNLQDMTHGLSNLQDMTHGLSNLGNVFNQMTALPNPAAMGARSMWQGGSLAPPWSRRF